MGRTLPCKGSLEELQRRGTRENHSGVGVLMAGRNGQTRRPAFDQSARQARTGRLTRRRVENAFSEKENDLVNNPLVNQACFEAVGAILE